jgi:queuosine precursor transporter
MNEILFLIHIPIVIGFLFLFLRFGKEALIAFISCMGLLANFFVLKQIELFSFTVTCSDVFAVGAILGLNLLQEYFGKDEAKRAVKISFLVLIFFLIMSQIHLFYAPSSFDVTQGAYLQLLKPSIRIVGSSLAVFFLVQRLDILLFSFLKKAFQEKLLAMRLFLSLLISQFCDTALFSFLGLYGLVHAIFDIILISFAIKVAIILFSAPIASFSKRFMRNS